MNRLIFVTAFLLGIGAIIWMGSSFIGTDLLALTVTGAIAAVYLLGFVELSQFRQATGTLNTALADLHDAPMTDHGALDSWLRNLHPSLRNAASSRIQGDRAGLPAPVFTPYLVGLLVMLGLLGTFVGMVETLGGAVAALEGTTELEAIRKGLAAPIRGLGLAFGTSVAGVATSAMLGLTSTLCRRERMLATRNLDRHINGVFREFSLAYNRQQTYRALQSQAQALPQVAQRMEQLADSLDKMGEHLGNTLLANQQQFHSEASEVYTALANSVDRSLKDSLGESGRLAGESITPVVAGAMATISERFEASNSAMIQATVENLGKLEGTVAEHLAGLGQALEEPMTRFITTASETPRAAAQVIGELRKEIADNVARDNALLAERKQIMADLGALFNGQDKALKAQQESMNAMVSSSSQTLQDIGASFGEKVSAEVANLSGMAAEFAGGASEMSSLGEAFGLGVELFSDSNRNLVEHLDRIQNALDKSGSRSDEQMGYYVAQAREIIDHSLQSQREIIEQMRQLGRQQDFFPAEVS